MKRSDIVLKPDEIEYLQSFKRSGKKSRREYDRANILLLLHKGKTDVDIEDFLEVERTTIWRTRKKFLEDGLEEALKEKPRSGQPKKYGQKEEAEIVALACSDAPDGRTRWTLQLMEEVLSRKKGLETINRETIRLILRKTNVNRG